MGVTCPWLERLGELFCVVVVVVSALEIGAVLLLWTISYPTIWLSHITIECLIFERRKLNLFLLHVRSIASTYQKLKMH